MGFFLQRQKKSKPVAKKRDINDGIYTKCETCKEVLPVKQLHANLHVCPKCEFHHRMSAMTRIESLVDEGTFKELNQKLISKNQINEAVVTGIAKLDGQTVAIGVMDSYFMMASMGSVVGEKVTRLIETATSKKLPLVLVCASGGARMQEGMYSLMQMAKTSAAIAKHNEAGLLYISVLTQPTMGRRVVEQTIKQSLPEHFQTAEFLQEKGLVDKVVNRKELKQTLSTIIKWHEGSEN